MSARANRRHQVRRVAAARRPFAHDRSVSDNELAVRHPYDCGRRCLHCHNEKLLGAGRRRAAGKRQADHEIAASG